VTSTPGRRLLPAHGSRVLALAPGLLIAAALTIVDAGLQPSAAVIGIVVLAPLLTVRIGRPRDVAIIGVMAVALVALSAIWHENFGEPTYVYRIGVVAAAGLLAYAVAGGRARVGRDRERFALLAARSDGASPRRPASTTATSRSRGGSASATRRAPTRRRASPQRSATASRRSSTRSATTCSSRRPRTTSTSSCCATWG